MIKLYPIISEKTVALAKKNQFTFEVEFNLSKKMIELEIKRAFKINPISVNTMYTKPVRAKKANRFSVKKGIKRVIVKTATKEVIPGFESFLAQDKKDKNKEKSNDKNS